MAALRLHNTFFTREPPSPPPPSVPRRQWTSRVPHDRQLSSQSSVTLHTTTSEYSHPTDPLLHDSPILHGLLTRQPTRPSGPRTTWANALSLDAGPARSRGRRRTSDLSLRRLRWATKGVLYLMGAWAVYTTIRYSIAVTNYVNDHKIILLVLTSVSAFSVVLVILSAALSVFSRVLGWDIGVRSSYVTFQTFLGYSASLSLLGPAITNFVLVFLWRNASNVADSLRGRCTWDIDVAWSGTGGQCVAGHAQGWGLWLGGALVRLIATLIAVVAYHFLSHKYALARQPSRRKHGRTHLHSVSSPSVSLTGSETLHSDRSFRAMISTNHLPISLNRSGRQHSQSAEISDGSHESGTSSVSAEQRGSRVSFAHMREPTQAHSHSRDAQSSGLQYANESPSSSEEDLTAIGDGTARYGTPIRHIPGQYSLLHLDTTNPFSSIPDSSNTPSDSPLDTDLNNFVGHFRALVEQASQEGDAGTYLAQNGPDHYYADNRAPSPNFSLRSGQNGEDEDYFIVGGVVQRMPTIESLGSREVMSLATSSNRGERSVHSLSRPPTRQAMSMLSESTGSQSPSRTNSLSISFALSSPTSPSDGTFGSSVSEMGELHKPSSTHSAGTNRPSTKSSASGTYYTAASTGSATGSSGRPSRPT